MKVLMPSLAVVATAAMLCSQLAQAAAQATKSKAEDRAQRPTITPFAGLREKLKAEGWQQVGNPPEFLPRKVKGTFLPDGKRGQRFKEAMLRYSYVAHLPSIDIAPNQARTLHLARRYPEATQVVFELPDGKATSYALSKIPATFFETEKAFALQSSTWPADPKLARKIVRIQQRLELVENGKVIATWYMRSIGTVLFEKTSAPPKE